MSIKVCLTNLSILRLTPCNKFRMSVSGCRRCFQTACCLREKQRGAPPPPPRVAVTEGEERPVRFSGTRAQSWQSVDTFVAPPSTRPSYEIHIIVWSFVVMLVYFTMIRRENGIDEKLSTSLYDHMPGLESDDLKRSIAVADARGLDAAPLRARLAEITAEVAA